MTGRDVVLATARLRLTTWLDGDTEELSTLHADQVVMADMTTGTQTAEQTRARIHTWIAEHRTRGWSKWRLVDHDDLLLGRAGFGTAHHTRHREIGYLLRREAWNHGLATEIAVALASWHHHHPDPTVSATLHGYVYDTNPASSRVLRSAGFRPAGHDPDNPRELHFVHDRPGLRFDPLGTNSRGASGME